MGSWQSNILIIISDEFAAKFFLGRFQNLLTLGLRQSPEVELSQVG
jgi:hypothetical protein